LQEMLEKFTEAEKLDGGRVYNCGHCNAALVRPGRRAGRERRLSNRAQKFTEAEKQMKINELPQVYEEGPLPFARGVAPLHA